MGGIAGIFMIGVGVVWTMSDLQTGSVFALFGVIWTGIAVIQTVYNFKNAIGKNRYSAYDITDSGEETDSRKERVGGQVDQHQDVEETESEFCPYCGTKIEANYRFCKKCGRELGNKRGE